MPSVSKSQQRLMGAAEHGADFPMAEHLRQSMTHDQLHDFAVGPEAGKPEHVGHQISSMLKGSSPDIVGTNTKSLMQSGMNEFDATTRALKTAKPRHQNLGKFLHPRKDGKPHGTK